jgi:hypothetical protein
MSWQVIVALVIAVPVILLPVAFVWFLNVGGVSSAVREMRARRAVQTQKAEASNGSRK